MHSGNILTHPEMQNKYLTIAVKCTMKIFNSRTTIIPTSGTGISTEYNTLHKIKHFNIQRPAFHGGNLQRTKLITKNNLGTTDKWRGVLLIRTK